MIMQRRIFQAAIAVVLAAAALPSAASEPSAEPPIVVATSSARGATGERAPLSIVVYEGDHQLRQQMLAIDGVADTGKVSDARAVSTTAQR